MKKRRQHPLQRSGPHLLLAFFLPTELLQWSGPGIGIDMSGCKGKDWCGFCSCSLTFLPTTYYFQLLTLLFSVLIFTKLTNLKGISCEIGLLNQILTYANDWILSKYVKSRLWQNLRLEPPSITCFVHIAHSHPITWCPGESASRYKIKTHLLLSSATQHPLLARNTGRNLPTRAKQVSSKTPKGGPQMRG